MAEPTPSVKRWEYQGPTQRSKTVVVIGWVTAILLPFVGVVMGVIALSQGHRGHGTGIIVVSALMLLLYMSAVS